MGWIRKFGSMALMGLASLAMFLQGCAPTRAAQETTPSIVAAEATPLPETSTAASAGLLSSPRPSAVAAPQKTMDPMLGDFETVNNFLESNGAGAAVGGVISPENIQVALVDYYGRILPNLAERDPYERVLNIYEALPYKDGALVLAERRRDGESGPSLHYILDGKVETVSGEGVWWINYTFLEGEYIFYGLTAMEPLAGDAAFIYQDRGGALRRYPLRDGKWFIAPVGKEFPTDLYFVDELGQRVSEKQGNVFYQPEGEILTSRLLYHPMLPEGVEAAYLPLLRAEGEELAMPMFAWSEMDAQESVPPAVVWRNATTAMAQYSGEKELRFADMDGITAVYLAKVDEDGQTDDGADRLQPLSLMDIRNDDGKLPLPDGPGLYAYVVDKTVNGGLARYGLAFQVRE